MKFEITKEQILENYKNGLKYQDYVSAKNLKEWFPNAFKTELEVGVWYKSNDGMLFNFNGKYSRERDSGSFGINKIGKWNENIGVALDGMNNYTEATPEEVETAIINESKKRGYKPNNFKCISMPSITAELDSDRITWENNKLWMGTPTNANCIFQRGEWAEIIPQEKTVVPMEKALKIIAKKIKVAPENIEICSNTKE